MQLDVFLLQNNGIHQQVNDVYVEKLQQIKVDFVYFLFELQLVNPTEQNANHLEILHLSVFVLQNEY